MATETDIRLRSWLDSNQRDREQMCRAILELDSCYTQVRPRHPSGGPDGGRDIEALFDNIRTAFGAVGFTNGANDSEKQKKQIRKKFSADLTSALLSNPDLKVFAFLTNVHLAMGEQNAMKKEAQKAGLERCDIFDRERLRIELDSPSGFFVRFQYLSIPLSEAEQASFLSKYGRQIQDVVTTGFQKVEKTLNRLLFLAESKDALETLTFRFVLKKSYAASEIGHYRAFVFLTLREWQPGMFMMWFGSADKADRFRDDTPKRDMQPGIGEGIGSGQWENYLSPPTLDQNQQQLENDIDTTKDETTYLIYRQTSWSSGIGLDPIPAVFAQHREDAASYFDRPRLSLSDINDGMFLPFVNDTLAEKIHCIQIFADGYKLDEFGPDDFKIDRSECGRGMPGEFTEEELADRWVRLRPANFSSAHRFRFWQTTPKRMYSHEEPVDSAPPQELIPNNDPLN
jgi:hypothetical protein